MFLLQPLPLFLSFILPKYMSFLYIIARRFSVLDVGIFGCMGVCMVKFIFSNSDEHACAWPFTHLIDVFPFSVGFVLSDFLHEIL